MSVEWVTLIAGFLGTILGVSIPSFAKYLENKSSHSKENKEKHEVIMREILSDFIPLLRYTLYLSRNYIKNKREGLISSGTPEIVGDKFDDLRDYFNGNIRDHYPLEMHKKITDLIADLEKLGFDIALDDVDTDIYTLQIMNRIEKCEKLIEDIVKHIEKKYI